MAAASSLTMRESATSHRSDSCELAARKARRRAVDLSAAGSTAAVVETTRIATERAEGGICVGDGVGDGVGSAGCGVRRAESREREYGERESGSAEVRKCGSAGVRDAVLVVGCLAVTSVYRYDNPTTAKPPP